MRLQVSGPSAKLLSREVATSLRGCGIEVLVHPFSFREVLRVAQVIRADREKLFRAWSDPAELVDWWRMEEKRRAFAGASIDLRVGGRYRLGMTSPEGKTHVAIGEYRVIARPKRLAFTWDWDDPESAMVETLVTVEFNDVGGGDTEVVLTHERFADPGRVSRHEQGWSQLLRLLDNAVRENAA